jgi:predicted nucleotidyltransferase
MALQLPSDFSDFLSLLNAHSVEYLLVGGYAVTIHGYVRATGDMDIFIAATPDNAARVADAIREFGFDVPSLTAAEILAPRKILRMGSPPLRIEVMNEIDGVEFAECRARALDARIGDLQIPVISLRDLRANKRAAGRHKDLDDLDNLPSD